MYENPCLSAHCLKSEQLTDCYSYSLVYYALILMTIPVIIAVAVTIYGCNFSVKECFAKVGFERIFWLRFSEKPRSSWIELSLLRIHSDVHCNKPQPAGSSGLLN